jgi:hypothetical protein
MSIVYHRQSDNQMEVVNKCLETHLLCFSSDKQHQWVQWIPLA